MVEQGENRREMISGSRDGKMRLKPKININGCLQCWADTYILYYHYYYY